MPRYSFNISTWFWQKLPDRSWLMLKVFGNIYFRPGLGKSVLLTEVFLAKDRVPVGTRSAAKKTEVSKTDFVSPRVEMYLPYAVIRVINLLIEMFHVCTSLLTIVVWENQNDLGQFRFPNTLTIMPRRAEMLSQNFPTARANAKGISRHMVKSDLVAEAFLRRTECR